MKMGRCSFRFGALAVAAVLGCMAPAAPVLAQVTEAAVPAGNRIEKMVAAEQGGSIVLKLTMAQPLAAAPGSFSVANPARIAFDFPDTANGLGRNSQVLNTGDLRSVNIVQVGDRTRLVLNLSRVYPYETRIEERDVFITLASGPFKEATGMVPQATQFAPAVAGQNEKHAIRDVNFRRGKDGRAVWWSIFPTPMRVSTSASREPA
jgi:type IV pilus assembly protein PilQ